MVEISDQLLCLFTSKIDAEEVEEGNYTISIPEAEIEDGQIDTEGIYQVALIDRSSLDTQQQPARSASATSDAGKATTGDPPVNEGDIIDVEIESIGEQGDGIAKVGPGYVVIISDTEIGEQVSARVSKTKDSVAFAEVVDRHPPDTHSD
jgi:predicted RNA-binding protein with TRAM domain